MNTLKIGDPVNVDQKSTNSPPLQGVISYLGLVDFAEGDDWVGVRLTGDSVGKGKNDGTVQGKKYFEDCPPNGGVFVRSSHVHKRILSKLEELRLKRELKGMGQQGAASSPSPRRITSSTANIVSKSASGEDDDSSVSSMRSSATGASNRSRLEEIRQRRLELQRNKNKLMSPPSSSKNIISEKAKSNVSLSEVTTPSRNMGTKGPNDHVSSRLSATDKAAVTPAATTRTRTNASPLPTAQASSASTATAASDATIATVLSRSVSLEEVNLLKEKIQELNLELQNKENVVESLSKELEMKQTDEKSTKTQMQSLMKLLLEKENEAKNLQNRVFEVEQISHDSKLALEASKTEVVEIRRKLDSALNDAKTTTETEFTQVSIGDVLALKEEIAELKATNNILEREKVELNDVLTSTQRDMSSLRYDIEREREISFEKIQTLQKDISDARLQASTFEKELSQTTEKAALRDDKSTAHYKDKAKLQAEILSWQRKVQELENEKIEANNAFEDLTLDKEQLAEKLEILEEKVEELKIDAESAQIEVDELRMELQDARDRAEKAEAALCIGTVGGSSQGNTVMSDSDEVTQALSVQNSRLREAIIRLREQTAIEKMELSRQLRAAEKDSSRAASLKEEVAKLHANEKVMKDEIKELKEMVDQGSAFEQMVEDLSDRVLAVEDNNITLQSTIRELEEGAELSAEMEEAQAEEIKVLMIELQNRETVVVTLEEAIKMQRKRELDFQRTIGNYRTVIETLQKERDAVLKELGGRDGAQVDAMLTTQKALAQAAQSVADAALARKKEVEVSFNLIDAQVKSHLAARLENFLPQSVASSEISAVKGELLLSKVAMKASLSLSSISEIYQNIRSKASDLVDNTAGQIMGTKEIIISSGLAQNIGIMLHQAKYSRIALEISSECIYLLSAGQWPSLLSYNASIDLGIFAAQTIPALDSSISEQLFLLKREGGLSPDQSNLNSLDQAFNMMRSKFKEAAVADGSLLLPPSWSPPGLAAAKLFSLFKFNCLGFAAVLGVIITDDSDKMQNGASMLKSLMTKAEKLCSDITIVSQTMSALSVLDGEAKDMSFALAQSMHNASNELFSSLENVITTTEIHSSVIPDLDSQLIVASNALMKLQSFLRSQHIADAGEQSEMLLSPECVDAWTSVVEVASKAQSANGDSTDLNYIIRSQKLEQELSLAVENDAKLSIADAKIKSLEKNLSTRSNEISLQNARLEELETLLAQVDQSSTQNTHDRAVLPNENILELKEEVRVLNEAMEVLQSQVDEYEREIRMLKDQKARSYRHPNNSTGKGASLETVSLASGIGMTSPQNNRNDQGDSVLSLESALFRPALHDAISDASMWKSTAVYDKLLRLPSLSKDSHKNGLDMINQSRQLSLAHADLRLVKANIGIISLQESKSNARSLLFKEKEKALFAMRKLEALTDHTRFATGTTVA
mmetsp:Transcript_4225/g.8073  ORF Transcript_4225/g.8073 Transcript_4225/m.8073 type:complete len:1444 (+) Transcript_4225:81-4412(+)|eukprot:CAMPEP_0176483256 /NCGR_PEP_ID=MMETSP0200_2-20121128/3821_1 /TAXON_ID=947934 /ORGANISM="Chaetoceros sp., Strain GSL56" /LENGTH=1443 /DNA_ID=CAMNT_0017879645 /DNA_START=28 /DNA_END=4359 /DNA_ORIENTATION=-